MRLNYNFAFKDSKLTPWERPAPPNLLISDVSLDKKFKFILKQFNSNKGLYYPSTIVIGLTLIVHTFNLYPKSIVKKFENDHYKYQSMEIKLRNLNSSKQRFKKRIKNLEEFFTQSTTSYLFSYFLQNSVPKGVQINRYSFSDNGFDITVSAFNLDSLDEFITLLIESPVILKDSVKVNQLTRKESIKSNDSFLLPDLELEIYGKVKKINNKKREALYLESNANGLLKKLKRFNYLKQKLGS
tara:strand:- start:1549 stop:2274 length:726 start_codon:yes stop_codon:yes gene_type:complete